MNHAVGATLANGAFYQGDFSQDNNKILLSAEEHQSIFFKRMQLNVINNPKVLNFIKLIYKIHFEIMYY